MKIAIDFGQLESTATPNFPTGTSVGDIISAILEIIIPIAGFILLFFLIWASYQYMTSAGDPKGMQAAKNNITYALLGFILILAAYTIANIFGVTLGLQGIIDIFPN